MTKNTEDPQARKRLGPLKNTLLLQTQHTSGGTKGSLPAIGKLCSSDGSEPDAGGSEDDLDVSDEDNLGALAFQMNRESVVGASSGRNLLLKDASGVKGINPEEYGAQAPSSQTTQIQTGVLSGLLGPQSQHISA